MKILIPQLEKIIIVCFEAQLLNAFCQITHSVIFFSICNLQVSRLACANAFISSRCKKIILGVAIKKNNGCLFTGKTALF